MSLKIFHILFVVSAIILSFIFGVWTFQSNAANPNATYVMLGILSFISAFVFILYLVKVIKKLKTLNSIAFFLVLSGSLMIPKNLYACAVCFGATDAASRMALGGAILFLLAIVLAVLGGIVAFFVNLKIRAKRMVHLEGRA